VPCRTKNKQWAADFKDFCSKDNCTCDTIEARAVGKKYPLSFGPPPSPKNSSLPAQCQSDFYPIPFLRFNATPYATSRTDLASCCASCDGKATPSCTGYSYKKDLLAPSKGTCDLFHVTGGGFPSLVPAPLEASGFFNSQTPVQRNIFTQIDQLATELNGAWYSTREEGECQPGQEIGTGDCWWRLREVSALRACVSVSSLSIVRASMRQGRTMHALRSMIGYILHVSYCIVH
jgi:hypothetical protein